MIVAAWIVVALHVVFALAETVGWRSMAARLGYSREDADVMRRLAANQGAYNAGVAALLGWALIAPHPATVIAILIFIVVMAVVGAASVRWTIFVVQGVPALVALAGTLV